jgi:hypothetical protein
LGFVIFFVVILVPLVIGAAGALVWAGYTAERETYRKARTWKRDELRPRRYATGLSRRPPRKGFGRPPIERPPREPAR